MVSKRSLTGHQLEHDIVCRALDENECQLNGWLDCGHPPSNWLRGGWWFRDPASGRSTSEDAMSWYAVCSESMQARQTVHRPGPPTRGPCARPEAMQHQQLLKSCTQHSQRAVAQGQVQARSLESELNLASQSQSELELQPKSQSESESQSQSLSESQSEPGGESRVGVGARVGDTVRTRARGRGRDRVTTLRSTMPSKHLDLDSKNTGGDGGTTALVCSPRRLVRARGGGDARVRSPRRPFRARDGGGAGALAVPPVPCARWWRSRCARHATCCVRAVVAALAVTVEQWRWCARRAA
eukprot:364853-Chlamydomonas_euryale.AAC.2